MSRGISVNDVGTAVIDGINNAFSQYMKWANRWLDHAPEYFVTCKIAERLAKVAGTNSITLEAPIAETLGEARAQGPGRSHSKLPRSGRFDIILWNPPRGVKQSPRVIIEVKHPIYLNVKNQLKDVERICRALNKGGNRNTVKFGVLAFYSASETPKMKHRNASIRLRSRLEPIENSIRSIAKTQACKSSLKKGRVHKRDDEAWAGCCAILSRK